MSILFYIVLLSLSIMFLDSFMLYELINFFLLLISIPWFICSLIGGRLGCFILAAMNKVAVNIFVQVFW